MVHTGRPSRGCDVCRRRRIKCDEAEPNCSYCLKKGVPCPGYKSQFDVAWRDQNVVAEKSVQRRKRTIDNSERHKEKQKSEPLLVEVPRALSQDHAGYAVDFFFSFYICRPKDQAQQRGFFDCLYPVWTDSGSTSPLRPIVTAVASVMLDAWSQVKPDQPGSLSRSQYTRGIAALRKSLQSTDDASDETIMATLMLNMYDNLVSFLTAQPNSSLHINGTTALIDDRRKRPVIDETSKRMILATRSQVVGRALNDAENVPPTISSWSEVTYDIAKTPGFRLDELNIKLANLQALVSRLSPQHPGGTDHVILLLDQAIELDQQYSAWMEDLPSDWTPIRVSGTECIPQSAREAGLYQDYCEIYKSVWVANTFNAYCSARTKMQMTIIKCLEWKDLETSRTSVPAALMVIQDLADTMCASVPFHLGDRTGPGRIDDTNVRFPSVGGHSLPEGHHIASGAYGGFLLTSQIAGLLSPAVPLRLGQKQWIGRQIGRIRRICNIAAS